LHHALRLRLVRAWPLVDLCQPRARDREPSDEAGRRARSRPHPPAQGLSRVMRYLILSDIHANLEALEAVIRDAEGRYERVVCLGDVVGYGADPNAVCEWVRENADVIIRGNHDKACCGLED